MKIWKGNKEKTENSETIGAVTHTHTHTHTHGYSLKDVTLNGNAQNSNIIKNRRTRLFVVPLIVVLMLICVVVAIRIVGASSARPQETAELNKDIETNEEQISAESVTVEAGDSYTIDKDGIYKIELHGGQSAEFKGYKNKGTKITGYVKLNAGTSINTGFYSGGAGWSDSEGMRG